MSSECNDFGGRVMGRVKDIQLFTLFRNFLTIYLPVQRNVSENTVVDYRTSLNQLLEYISVQRHISYMSVTFEMINKETVNAFLDHLTEEKKFSPATRNNRLAAIKSFLSYASGVYPEYISFFSFIHPNICSCSFSAFQVFPASPAPLYSW